MANCKSCGEQIVWARTVNGKAMPIDPIAITNGNVVVVGQTAEYEPLVAVLAPRVIDEYRRHGTVILHRSHFASCPDAELWRQTQQKEREA
jgi:hypothetical protein